MDISILSPTELLISYSVVLIISIVYVYESFTIIIPIFFDFFKISDNEKSNWTPARGLYHIVAYCILRSSSILIIALCMVILIRNFLLPNFLTTKELESIKLKIDEFYSLLVVIIYGLSCAFFYYRIITKASKLKQ